MPEDAVHVMRYHDFKLDVTTEPDLNGCMWLEMRRFVTAAEADYIRQGGAQRWDMDERCVRRLRDACDRFLANSARQAEANEACCLSQTP